MIIYLTCIDFSAVFSTYSVEHAMTKKKIGENRKIMLRIKILFTRKMGK